MTVTLVLVRAAVLALSRAADAWVISQAPTINPAIVKFATFDPRLAPAARARRQSSDAIRRSADALRRQAGAIDSGGDLALAQAPAWPLRAAGRREWVTR